MMSVHLTYSGCAATARTCGADVIHGRAGGAGATQSIDPDRQSPPAWLALNGGEFGSPRIKNLHWQHTTHIQLMPHCTTSILGRAASSAQLCSHSYASSIRDTRYTYLDRELWSFRQAFKRLATRDSSRLGVASPSARGMLPTEARLLTMSQ